MNNIDGELMLPHNLQEVFRKAAILNSNYFALDVERCPYPEFSMYTYCDATILLNNQNNDNDIYHVNYIYLHCTPCRNVKTMLI